ncbi:MAG: septum formation initiator family protein [Bacteroidia bacterium]|nr:septum formation initiator family protein [Bacteroidia bacterium]
MLDRLPRIFRNFFFLAGLLFVLWMIFLDSNDLISRFKLTNKLHSLEREREYYHEKIQEVEKDRNELFGTKESVEKFAREKYLMKKDNEDVFVIVEED